MALSLLVAVAASGEPNIVSIEVEYADGSVSPYDQISEHTQSLFVSVWGFEERGLSASPSNRITAITGLPAVTGLQDLTFYNVIAISDFGFLRDVRQVENLVISLCAATELSFISGMSNLRTFVVSSNYSRFGLDGPSPLNGKLIDLTNNNQVELVAIDDPGMVKLPVLRSVPPSLQIVQLMPEHGTIVTDETEWMDSLTAVPYVFLPGCVVSEEALVSYPNVSTAYLTPDEIDALLGDLRAGRAVDRSRFRDES